MTTYEFTILIEDRRVTGQYGVCGEQLQQAGSAELNLDPLALETVGLMNRWLSFWDLIDRSEIRLKETLLQGDTLDVLGTHLWRLILDNDVGRQLKEKIPREGQQPLKLSIEFAPQANEKLKGLPWEFLYEPQNEWYLATKTELLLTRYVTTDREPATVAQAGEKEKLRALLIAALPDKEKFAIHRERLNKLRTALSDLPNLDVPKPIEAWNAETIYQKLAEQPYHIVHVVGICKGTPGHPQIYLGDGGDGYEDPGQFVETLTANPKRPRLVILQLCDFADCDATENFERMAPDLIKRRVPAVLALQYAASADQADADNIGLGKRFYQSLVDGERIGAAVQASRKRLLQDRRDRRFGTPVLYLQQEDVALRRPGSQGEPLKSTAQSGTSEDAIRKRGFDSSIVTKALGGVVLEAGLGKSEAWDILTWVSDLGRLAGFDAVRIAINEKLQQPLAASHLDIYTRMLVCLGELRSKS